MIPKIFPTRFPPISLSDFPSSSVLTLDQYQTHVPGSFPRQLSFLQRFFLPFPWPLGCLSTDDPDAGGEAPFFPIRPHTQMI